MIRQIPVSHWPDKLEFPIAMLRADPLEITSKCGIGFEFSSDDLDYLNAAIVNVDGIIFALVRHCRNPVSGTEIWSFLDVEHPKKVLEVALDLLRMKDESILWKHPSLLEIDAT